MAAIFFNLFYCPMSASNASSSSTVTPKVCATSCRLLDELAAQGVEVMDGDPLGWDWKLN